MKSAVMDGARLEYQVSGDGEPVFFIHGALTADAFLPLVAEPSLAGFKLITYHRRGYMGSSHDVGPISVPQQAADCRALLRHLGIDRAHVAGHSYGGSIALHLALESPDVVHSLALLEPALAVGATAQSYREALARGPQRYKEGPAATVVDEFVKARWGSEYRGVFERMLPGGFGQVVADSRTFFEQEILGLLEWKFDEEEARRITQPALSLLGGKSNVLWPRFGETHRVLLAWLPLAEGAVIPGGTHWMQMQNPRDTAEALATFFARHPILPLN